MMGAEGTSMRRGAGALMEVGLALAIVALALPSLVTQSTRNRQAHEAAVLAQDIKRVETPFVSYIHHNYTTLMNLTNGGGSIEIPISGSPIWQGIGDLQNSQYFPSNFNGSLPAFQKLKFAVRQVPATAYVPAHLSGIIASTGGDPFTDYQVRAASQLLGGDGGGVTKKVIQGQAEGNIIGAFGGWTSTPSQWNLTGLTAGHVVLNPDVNMTSNSLSDFLNRYWTGNPEANRMHTWLDMNGQGISNALTIDGVSNNDVFLGDANHKNTLAIRGGGMVDENLGLSFVSYGSAGSQQEGIIDAQLRRDNRWLLLAGQNGIVGLEGNLAKFQKIGLSGLEPDSGYPQGWGGGVHTWDVYAEGTVGVGQEGQVNSSLDFRGVGWTSTVLASTRLALQNLRPVHKFSGCNLQSEGASPYNTVSLAVMAPLDDGSGGVAACVNGIWSPLSGGLPTQITQVGGDYVNTSGLPEFGVWTNDYHAGKHSNEDWSMYLNGYRMCRNESDAGTHWTSGMGTCAIIIPPGGHVYYYGNAGDVSGKVYRYQ